MSRKIRYNILDVYPIRIICLKERNALISDNGSGCSWNEWLTLLYDTD